MSSDTLFFIIITFLAGGSIGIAVGVAIVKSAIGQRLLSVEQKISHEADNILVRLSDEVASLRSHTTAVITSAKADLKADVAAVKSDVSQDLADVKGTLNTVATTTLNNAAATDVIAAHVAGTATTPAAPAATS